MARVWDMGHWSITPPLFEVMASRAFCLRLPVHEMFIVIIKANTIRFEEDAGNHRYPFRARCLDKHLLGMVIDRGGATQTAANRSV